MPVDLVRRPDLTELPEKHDAHAVCQIPHDGKVVADEQKGQLAGGLQLLQQVQNLILHRHIQRRDRLVADDEARVRGDGPRDADALALAAGKLVRKAGKEFLRNADRLQQPAHPRGRLISALAQLPGLNRLGNQVPHRHPGVQGGVRVLEDELHLFSQRFEFAVLHGGDAPAAEQNLAGRRHQRADQQPAQRGFAAARFPDQTEGFALANLQRDAGHGVYGFLPGGERLRQFPRLQQNAAHFAAPFSARKQRTL